MNRDDPKWTEQRARLREIADDREFLWPSQQKDREAVRAALARVDALERHYEAAGPEHNLLALLDLYHERALKAEWERDELAQELNGMQEK